MRFVEVDQLDDTLADALYQMYTGEGDALIIHNAFDPEVLQQLVGHLEAEGARYHWDLQEVPDPAVRQMRVLGRTLTPVAGEGFDLDAYARIGAQTAAILEAHWPTFFSTLEGITEKISGGRSVRRAASNGREYGPATVRHLPVGCQIPAHCGQFFMESAGYRELMADLDQASQLSWFVPMQTAEDEGALLVYDLAWEDPGVPQAGPMYDAAAIEARPATVVAPPAGALLLFDGGRWFHKVSAVEGRRDRWTVGGFLGFTKAMDRIVYWS